MIPHQSNHSSKQQARRCYISLAYSIGSISMACGSLLQLNSTSDRISLQRGLFLTSLGFLYFVSLTDFFNKYFLETKQGIRFRRKYHLMVSDVMDITNKIVSAIQAAFSCLAGFIVCKSSCSKSFLYASHFVMEAYAWFGTAYFMYDIWSMYKVHTQKIADKLRLMNITTRTLPNEKQLSTLNNGKFYDKRKSNEDGKNFNHDITKTETENIVVGDKSRFKNDENEYDYGEVVEIPKDGRWGFLKYIITHPVMIIHHVFIGTFGLVVITYLRGGFGDCVYSFIYLMEFSTPFVSLRSILSTLGLKNTQMYIINGLMMLVSFFICRILMWPYVFHGYSIAINRPFFQAIMGLPRGCKISILILFLPQVYWFSLMAKGAVKVLFNPKQTNNSKENKIKQTEGKSSSDLYNGRPTDFNDGANQKLHPSSINHKKRQVKSPIQSRTLF